MRILLDESLPQRLSGAFPGHAVQTVAEKGWSGLKNGDLLRLAAPEFDVFVTADQNLQFQQNLGALPLAVIVLVAPNTKLETLRPLIPEAIARLATLPPRTLTRVGG
jgi:predicted nuclease of predicted toxin-antitoxin system